MNSHLTGSRRALPVALASILTLAIVGCDQSAAVRRKLQQVRCDHCNVVLISVDTLRADHVGAYGYERRTTPNIDRFFERGVLFERAFSPIPQTLSAHTTLLTGLEVEVHGVVPGFGLDDRLTTLSQYFQANGYRTAGFTAEPSVLGASSGFDRGFDRFVSESVDAREITTRALHWIDETAGQRFFLFLHYYDVHSDLHRLPYETGTKFDFLFAPRLAGFDGCSPGDDSICATQFLASSYESGFRRPSNEELERIVALYDGGVAFVDDQLGRLFEGLAARGSPERIVVALVADHGEEFLEHARFLHGQSYVEVTRVPLMIRLPANLTRTARLAGTVGLIDVMPTLLNLTGISHRGLQGLDLFQARASSRVVVSMERDPVTSGLTSGRFVRNDDYAFRLAGDAPIELFDARRDPGERRNLLSQTRTHTVEALLRAYRGYREANRLAKAAAGLAPRGRELSREERERLRSLGYLK